MVWPVWVVEVPVVWVDAAPFCCVDVIAASVDVPPVESVDWPSVDVASVVPVAESVVWPSVDVASSELEASSVLVTFVP